MKKCQLCILPSLLNKSNEPRTGKEFILIRMEISSSGNLSEQVSAADKSPFNCNTLSSFVRCCQYPMRERDAAAFTDTFQTNNFPISSGSISTQPATNLRQLLATLETAQRRSRQGPRDPDRLKTARSLRLSSSSPK